MMALYLLGVPWLLYLVADVYVTSTIRFPIPLFFAILMLLTWPGPRRPGVRDVFRLPAWAWWPVVFFAVAALREPLQSAAYAAVFLSLVLVFRHCVGRDPDRYRRLCRLFAVVLLLSAALLMLSWWRPALGAGVRATLLGADEMQVLQPTGLATMVHIYGYQAAALGALGFGLVYFRAKSDWPGVLGGAAVLGFVVVVVLLSWQRSAALGAGVAAAVAVARHGPRTLPRTGAVLALLSLPVVLAVANSPLLDNTIVGKNRGDVKKEWRLELQSETLAIIAQYPLGLVAEGQAWDYSLFRWGGALSRKGVSGHNSYLMCVAYFGWSVGLLILYVLARTGSTIWRWGLRRPDTLAGVWAAAMACVFIAVAVNALLHNSSLFNAEGSTIFSYVAVWHWRDMTEGEHGC